MSNQIILFYSEKCGHSENILKKIANFEPLRSIIRPVSIDPKNIKLPPNLKSVPSFLVDNKIISGDKAFEYVDFLIRSIKENYQKNQENTQHQQQQNLQQLPNAKSQSANAMSGQNRQDPGSELESYSSGSLGSALISDCETGSFKGTLDRTLDRKNDIDSCGNYATLLEFGVEGTSCSGLIGPGLQGSKNNQNQDQKSKPSDNLLENIESQRKLQNAQFTQKVPEQPDFSEKSQQFGQMQSRRP